MTMALGQNNVGHIIAYTGCVIGLVIIAGSLALRYSRLRQRTRHKSLHARLNEAALLQGQGQYEQAEELLFAVRARCKPSIRADQEIILQVGMALAGLLTDRGRLADAEADLLALLAEHGPERYPDRPDAWLALSSLASVVVARGRYAEGIALADRVADEGTEWFGTESPIMLRVQLGWCLCFGDQPERAAVVLTELIAVSDRVQGPDGAVPQFARRLLAEVQLRLGRLDEAEDTFRVLSASYADVPYRRHSLAGVNFCLAKIAALRERYDEARDGFTDVLADLLATVGEDGPWTLETRFELAEVESRQGNKATALAEHQDVLARRTRVLGVNHPLTAASRAAVAECGR